VTKVRRVMEMELWEKVVFLDRDGVVNEERHHESGDRRNYVTTWEEFVWIPGSKEAIVKLLENDYFVVIVSNQACVGKGQGDKETGGQGEWPSLVDIQRLMNKMKKVIRKAFPVKYHPEEHSWKDPRLVNLVSYICPHTEEGECSCRKPKPGMIYAAAYDYSLCLKHAWIVGDRLEDLKAGWAAGIRKLVRIEEGQEIKMPEHKWMWKKNTLDGIPFPDLKTAVDFIVEYDGG
jgi:histidinol-phosphate phosphatase family protein